MRITTTLIAIILSAGLTWSGCDKDSGGGSGGPGVDSVLPGEDSKVPGEDIKVPGEDTKVPGEDTKVPGEDTTVTPDTGCTPACEGKECGDDGCGGSCGACEDDETCDLGICVESPPGPICGDDVCEPPEDFGTCPEDCEEPVDPPTCTEDADCAGTPPCPAEAPKGCVCVPGPNGNACIPACDTAADCPDIEGVELICLPDGFCGPGTIEPDCGDGQCIPPGDRGVLSRGLRGPGGPAALHHGRGLPGDPALPARAGRAQGLPVRRDPERQRLHPRLRRRRGLSRRPRRRARLPRRGILRRRLGPAGLRGRPVHAPGDRGLLPRRLRRPRRPDGVCDGCGLSGDPALPTRPGRTEGLRLRRGPRRRGLRPRLPDPCRLPRRPRCRVPLLPGRGLHPLGGRPGRELHHGRGLRRESSLSAPAGCAPGVRLRHQPHGELLRPRLCGGLGLPGAAGCHPDLCRRSLPARGLHAPGLDVTNHRPGGGGWGPQTPSSRHS